MAPRIPKNKKGPQNKHIEAAERVRASTIGAGEPVIRPEFYRIDIINAMTYYNVYEEVKPKRAWVEKYIGADKAKLALLSKVDDYYLTQLSTLIRLKDRDQPLLQKEIDYIDTKLETLLNIAKSKDSKNEDEKSPKSKPVLSIEEKISNIADPFITELELEIDSFITNKKSSFDMKSYIEAKEINPKVLKVIQNWFAKMENEVEEAILGVDPQLVEAYSYFTPAVLKKYKLFLHSITSTSVQLKAKIERIKKVKIKPPSEVIKNVKYMEEFPEFGLKSIHPTKLINSTEVWLYNTESRRTIVLKAPAGDVLLVKGTTILNFDESKSECKTIRKPEEFFKTGLTKKDLNATMATLTTKPSVPNGRINEKMIILAVF